jgi:hypothetical protein
MVQCPNCSAQNLPDSRFCSSCAQLLSAPSQMPTPTGVAAELPKAQGETPHVARIISSDSIPAGGFTPGTILADRYRIIGLLGRGGMGEVYRADDLKLGQAVALKFLPPKLAEDPVRRERFFAEVRITRQLAHPNICRVYDIGDIDGRHFLSMEFIDGEDLASLLKRIGHLTNEKALDIARQLAAGLAAAHERGVLHRDLKPANIMLDGHGRVRITDFGLAIAAEDETQAVEIAGTPAYMAPEQLAGKGATVRSDMYSLGLVLYEIYTGKKAFTATNLAELREQKETRTPRAPSEIRKGIDPVVERLIQRCMERDPNARPASVAQLALALPGGDPLAAALAAGETPSPEMVAASGGREGLRPAVAWGILAFIVLGTLAMLWMSDRFMLHRRIPFNKPPDVLVERSKDIIRKAGYSEKVADSGYGFMENTDLLRYTANPDKPSERWKNLDSQAILFWYRQSPLPLGLYIGPSSSPPFDPPLQFPGETAVILDTEGRLVAFRAVPTDIFSLPEITAAPPEWKLFFAEAGLDISQWKPADVQRNPLPYADARNAWQGTLPNRPGTAVRIEASSYLGRAVGFQIIGPWFRTATMESDRSPANMRVFVGLIAVLAASTIGAGWFFALRNLRFGRGDRRTATRLSIFAIAILMTMWVLGGNFSPSYKLIQMALRVSFSVSIGGLIWILYIAIEPFVRRRWPTVLISWTRAISGDWRDPLVSRDIFIGCAFGVLCSCGSFFIHAYLDVQPFTFTFETVLGIRFFISSLLGYIILNVFLALLNLCLLYLLTVLLRNPKVAFAALVLIQVLLNALQTTVIWTYPIFLVMFALQLFLLIRVGLVAAIFASIVTPIFHYFPVTYDSSAWYSEVGFAALAIFAAIVLLSFRFSLGRRPLLAASRLDE